MNVLHGYDYLIYCQGHQKTCGRFILEKFIPFLAN